MMEEGKTDAKYGNRIGYMMLQFPIVIHEDPLDYVRQGTAIAARKKNSLEAIASYFNAKLIVKLFGTKVSILLLKYAHSCHLPLVLSINLYRLVLIGS